MINLHCARYSSVSIRKFSLNELKIFIEFPKVKKLLPLMKGNLLQRTFAVFDCFVDVSIVDGMNYSDKIAKGGELFFFKPHKS